ncbi:multicopper oxidase domain-containing protein [Streptomyces sp. NPDC090021]|uniref:multicopper oxidase domain-containing protein n=1 Tax=Streptomyces sp. NPDC090021 TaxID=3365919 RepID=UPI0038267192
MYGHSFALGEKPGGARKDTSIVLPGGRLTADFDADNPGLRMTHCHNVHHSGSGMRTVTGYRLQRRRAGIRKDVRHRHGTLAVITTAATKDASAGMTTPQNPPSTPSGPPTEPAGTPAPETAPIPAPAQPLSLEKPPVAPAAAAAPAAESVSERTPDAAPGPAAEPAPEPAVEPAQADEVLAAAPAAADASTPAPGPSAAEPAAAQAAFASPAPAPSGPGAPFGAPEALGAPTAPFGAPGAPGDQWPAPGYGHGYGYGSAPYGGYAQTAPATNGLAVAALIVGGFGIMLGLVPLLFWLGGILALTGLGLGIGALVRANKGAPNRSMAILGTVLGGVGMLASVGGFFLTVAVFDRGPDRIEASIDEDDLDLDGTYPSSEPWPSKSPSPSQVPGLTSALPFGETFTYPGGVKVSLSKPTKYEPKGIIAREQVKNAVQITVTITNGSTAPHEVIYAVPNVRDDKGMTAEMVFDSGGGSSVPKMVQGSILPGESASGVVAFEIPEGTASITADISAGTLLDDVKYAGPIG